MTDVLYSGLYLNGIGLLAEKILNFKIDARLNQQEIEALNRLYEIYNSAIKGLRMVGTLKLEPGAENACEARKLLEESLPNNEFLSFENILNHFVDTRSIILSIIRNKKILSSQAKAVFPLLENISIYTRQKA